MSIPEGDYEKGKQIYKLRCLQCHTINSMAARTGPSLNGIMGRASGVVPDYTYSEANKKKNITWTRETMFEFLANPKKFMPGTKMVFPGLKKPEDRADLIKYMEVEGAKPPSSTSVRDRRGYTVIYDASARSNSPTSVFLPMRQSIAVLAVDMKKLLFFRKKLRTIGSALMGRRELKIELQTFIELGTKPSHANVPTHAVLYRLAEQSSANFVLPSHQFGAS
ncbi:unnamed protein product [Strongylus vulgaris]|uniref:Cytochrome c domain-containing protein n=1 Tax=Strongylus vulgaris TaxID=40348 RepID=A0A3P7JC36_STRVU|nr:unnamed protein product [Strongylus vulgaris]